MNRLKLGNLTKNLRRDQTPWEVKLWYYLRGNRFYGFKFKRQVPLASYIADFCCQEKKLIIELDGGQHAEDAVRKIDLAKEKYLKSKGCKILRFWNNEVSDNIEGVLEVIRRAVEARDLSPNLSPSPGERRKP